MKRRIDRLSRDMLNQAAEGNVGIMDAAMILQIVDDLADWISLDELRRLADLVDVLAARIEQKMIDVENGHDLDRLADPLLPVSGEIH